MLLYLDGKNPTMACCLKSYKQKGIGTMQILKSEMKAGYTDGETDKITGGRREPESMYTYRFFRDCAGFIHEKAMSLY